MSVFADFQVNGLFPSTVGGLGATVKYFPRILGSSIGATPATPSSTSPVGALWVPGDNKLNGKNFRVEAAGTFGSDTGDPSGTVQVILYAVTGTQAVPVYTTLAGTTAYVPLVGAVGSWSIVAKMSGDTASGIVGGSYHAYVNGLYNVAEAVTLHQLSGINFGSGNTSLYQAAPFGLVVGVTFGTTDATNTAKMYQFQIIAD